MYLQIVIAFFNHRFAFYDLNDNMCLSQEWEPQVSKVEGTIIAYEELENGLSLPFQEENNYSTS